MPVIINGSTGISGTDGSAATPAVQGTDGNTGMFFPAADTIAFAEGGTEVMRLDASGNLGIGTTTPGARIGVQSTTQYADILLRTSSVTQGMWTDQLNTLGAVGTVTNHPLTFYVNNGERARINTNGQFTISSQPSFRVSRSNANSVTGVVLFDNIYHNIGSHYNSSTGRFTAPVTGNYLFTANGGQGSAYGFDIRLNGATACRVEIVGVSFGYTWKAGVVVLRMNANDYVDVNVFTGAPQFEPGNGSFTGQLLS
jgi:hypothetical protein